VGDFTFGRRTLGDAIKIRGEYLRLSAGLGDDDTEISAYSNVTSTIKVLCVSAPAGWEDVEKLDLTESDNRLNEVMLLFDALREKEGSFRRQKIGASKT
jgi:hypothetical protein